MMSHWKANLVPHERTSRQRTLHNVGSAGQANLAEAVVVVVGAGGLGSPVIQYLAAAGIGTIHVFDDDVVELSNLNRQVIHSANYLGIPKVDNAVATAARIAPEIDVIGHQVRLEPETVVEQLMQLHRANEIDVIIDGSDSFDTRFTVHAGASALGLPVIFGALMEWSAQITMFWSAPASGPAVVLTDVFADTPTTRATPGCAETGVMGSVAGMTGTLMATETIKYILGIGRSLLGRLVIINALTATTTEIALGQRSSRQTESIRQIAALTPGEIPHDSLLLDVRRDEESEQNPGPSRSIRLPVDELLRMNRDDVRTRIDVSENGEQIVVFCASGPRSLTAARHLHSLGCLVAGYLDGGLNGHPQLNQSDTSKQQVSIS